MGDENHNNYTNANQAIFQFPINTLANDTRLKFIPLAIISKFLGNHHEEPNVFLFEFDILYRTYDYIIDAHKLKLFPLTLKAHVFIWFMGLGNKVITT